MQAEEELSSRTDNPKHLEICVFAGENGSFILYEDDGISMNYENGSYVQTEYRLDWDNRRFVIGAAKGDLSLVPEKRSYTIRFYGLKDGAVSGAKFNSRKNILTLEIGATPVDEEITVELNDTAILGNNIRELCYEIINRAQYPFSQKEALFRLINSGKPVAQILSTMNTMQIGEEMKSAISEILLA